MSALLLAAGAFAQDVPPAPRFRLTLDLPNVDGDPAPDALFRGEPFRVGVVLHNAVAEHERAQYVKQRDALLVEMSASREERQEIPAFVASTTAIIPHGAERWLDHCTFSMVKLPSIDEAQGDEAQSGAEPVTWFTDDTFQLAWKDPLALFTTVAQGVLAEDPVFATLGLTPGESAELSPGTYELRATYDTTAAALGSSITAGRAVAEPLVIKVRAADDAASRAWLWLRIAGHGNEAGRAAEALEAVTLSLASDETCARGDGLLLRSLLLCEAGHDREALRDLRRYRALWVQRGDGPVPAWLEASLAAADRPGEAAPGSRAAGG